MFDFSGLNSAVSSGAGHIFDRIGQGASPESQAPALTATREAFAQQQAITGFKVAEDITGWKIYCDASDQFRRLVSKA